MQKTLKTLLILIALGSLVGCSLLRFPGVYRLKVQQGNYIEGEMVEQLEPGMTKRQVEYVMGSPLIRDTFHPDRWDYYYSVRRGDEQLREYHLVLLFENELLSSWEGDYEPSRKSAMEDQAEALDKTQKKEEAKFKKNDERRF